MIEKFPTLHWQDLLKRVAGSQPGKTVVEIGAGSGEDTKRLEEIGAEVIAVDKSHSSLVIGRITETIKIPVASNMNALGLGNGVADSVFLANCLIFADNKQDVVNSVQEAARVTRNRVTICTNFIPTAACKEHTPEGLKGIVQSSGLKISKIGAVKIPEKPWAESQPPEHKDIFLVIEAEKKER